jgi:hypothetical protein
MLQDFLSGRPSISPDSTAPTVPTARENGFQPLFAARGAELASAGSARRIENVPEPELIDAPQIELVQENGTVQRIIVTCTCCQRIEIECEY